jgi:probable HAF family extracellular repeat protein
VLHAKSVQRAAKRVRSVVNRDRGLVAVPDLAGHAGRRSELCFGVSADGAVVVGGDRTTPQGSVVPFAGRLRVGCKTSARWAAGRARLMVFPPTAPWWSAGLKTPQGGVVPFAGRWMVGCKTSARWAAIGAWLGVFPPTAPWWSAGFENADWQRRAFRWTVDGGMQDLGTLGGYWSGAYGVSADGAVVVGSAGTPQGMIVPFAGRRGGMQDLGTLPGGCCSEAFGVSADGSVVVGWA